MDNKKFEEKCKKIVAKYHNEHTAGEMLMPDDVYVVWLCKALGNNKALLSTPAPDGMYYEITYNGEKNEAYVDAYKKQENVCVKFDQEGQTCNCHIKAM